MQTIKKKEFRLTNRNVGLIRGFEREAKDVERCWKGKNKVWVGKDECWAIIRGLLG